MAGARRRRWVGVCLSPVSILALLASGCTRTSPAPPPGSPHTLAIGYAGPAGQTQLLEPLITEPLLQSTPTGRHEPRLANRWSVDSEGLVVTVSLRQGVRFHDGAELTADVVRDVLDKARANPGQVQAFPSLANIRGIEASGYELRIVLEQPSSLLLDDLGISIRRGTPARPIGTGPFALTNDADGSMRLVAHSSYHRGRPSLDVVTVTAFPTVRTAWAAMMRGEIDFLFEVPIQAREFVQAESRVAMFRTDRPYAYMIGFNLDNRQLQPTAVRRALNHAVDREAIIDHALRGDGQPASGVWAAHWAYGGVERLFRHDPALADRMLTEAGYPPPTGAPPASDVMPARLRFTCLVPSEPVPFEPIALLVQRQLYDVGVDMQVEAVGTRELQRRVASGAYDAVLLPQNIGRGLSRPYVFWHSGQPNAVNGYSAADDALEALRRAVTSEELEAAASSFQRVLHDDPPAIFIATPRQARAVHRRFDVIVEPGLDVMQTVWRWQPAVGTATP